MATLKELEEANKIRQQKMGETGQGSLRGIGSAYLNFLGVPKVVQPIKDFYYAEGAKSEPQKAPQNMPEFPLFTNESRYLKEPVRVKDATNVPRDNKYTKSLATANQTKDNQNKVWGMTEEQWNSLPQYEKNRMQAGWGLNGYRPTIPLKGDPSILNNRPLPENFDEIMNPDPNPVQTPTGRMRTVEDFLSGTGEFKKQSSTQNPITVEEIRGMETTRRDIGDRNSAFGRVPGMEENRTRVYDSMGRKTYDSDVWHEYVPKFMEGNLNRATDLQKTRMNNATALQQANIYADADKYKARTLAESGLAEARIANRGKGTLLPNTQAGMELEIANVRDKALKYATDQGYSVEDATIMAQNAGALRRFAFMGATPQKDPETGKLFGITPDGKIVDAFGNILSE